MSDDQDKNTEPSQEQVVTGDGHIVPLNDDVEVDDNAEAEDADAKDDA